jgi:hypothetical protein
MSAGYGDAVQMLWWIKKNHTMPEHKYFVAEVLHADGKTHYFCMEWFGKYYFPFSKSHRSLFRPHHPWTY